jgi:hypothetical protein
MQKKLIIEDLESRHTAPPKLAFPYESELVPRIEME